MLRKALSYAVCATFTCVDWQGFVGGAIIEQILSAENVIGNSSAYHNVAVVLARNDAFDYACDIIELGQKKGGVLC